MLGTKDACHHAWLCHSFLTTVTMPAKDSIDKARFKSNKKMLGYSYRIHATVSHPWAYLVRSVVVVAL